MVASRDNLVTEVKIFPNKKTTSVLAGGYFVLADSFAVRCTVLKKRDGDLTVLFPATKNKNFDESREAGDTNRKYFDEAWPTSREIRELITGKVLDAYRATQNGAVTGNDAGAITKAEEEIPF